MKPEVSIIIPCFNRGALIKDTLNSVLNQSYTNWECIIVDDQSEDDSHKVIRDFLAKDKRFKFFVRPNSRLKGANACRNIGFEKSKGTYINWLDSDDILDKNHIDLHLKHHKLGDYISVTISNSLLFYNVPGDTPHKWSIIESDIDLLTHLISLKTNWPICAVFWNRSCLPIYRPFNENLTSSQEWTFHVEQVIRGIKYKIVNDTTVFIRRHENRIGKDLSPKKFRCSFLSRFIIFNRLYDIDLLDSLKEHFLVKKMIQSSKGAAELNYDKVILFCIFDFFKILTKTSYKFSVLKVVFLGIPLKRVFNKGERFFRL